MEKDLINSPAHYATGKIEVIEFLEDKFSGHRFGFHLANAVKYLSRAGKKDGEADLKDFKKAKWYVSRVIEILEAEKEDREPRRPNDMNPKIVEQANAMTKKKPEPVPVCGCGHPRDAHVYDVTKYGYGKCLGCLCSGYHV